MTGPGTLRTATTDELTGPELRAIRGLMDAAFATDEHGGFGDDDWDHALGGLHAIVELDGRIVSHGSVVSRWLHAAGTPLRTGYVEAVATAPSLQGRGLGSRVMRALAAHIEGTYELGALGTGSHAFYQRLGWRTWRGPTSVRLADGREERTPDEDGFILVLLTPTSPPLDLGAPLSCEWRPGDVW